MSTVLTTTVARVARTLSSLSLSLSLSLSRTHTHALLAQLLIYANKQDLLHALTPAEVAQMLNLVQIRDRQWQIVACSARTGDGLTEGLEWLVSVIK